MKGWKKKIVGKDFMLKQEYSPENLALSNRGKNLKEKYLVL